MKKHKQPEQLSSESLSEIDYQIREELILFAEDRMLEAMSRNLLGNVELFGQNVAVVRMQNDSGTTLKAYKPSIEARASGYVPDLWVEFGGNSLQDGCFIEVWPERDRLVEPVHGEDGGMKPVALPVKNLRPLTAKARNILFEGTVIDPCPVNG